MEDEAHYQMAQQRADQRIQAELSDAADGRELSVAEMRALLEGVVSQAELDELEELSDPDGLVWRSGA